MLRLQHLNCEPGKVQTVVLIQGNVPLPSQDKNQDQMRTAKWKVPSSLDYLGLYQSLLDCDRLKVTSLLPESPG